jgi:hypothetical protein
LVGLGAGLGAGLVPAVGAGLLVGVVGFMAIVATPSRSLAGREVRPACGNARISVLESKGSHIAHEKID